AALRIRANAEGARSLSRARRAHSLGRQILRAERSAAAHSPPGLRRRDGSKADVRQLRRGGNVRGPGKRAGAGGANRMKPLETERLLLRPFVVDDAEALHREIYSDEQVVRWYSSKGVLTLEQTRQHLVDHLREWSESDLGRHAVVLKE